MTFLAALRHDRNAAPCLFDGPINGASFLAYPAIAGLLKRDDRRREKYRETGWSWYAPVFEQPLHRRRLLILNSLFLALAAQRCSASERGDTGNELSITIGDTGFDIDSSPSPENRQP